MLQITRSSLVFLIASPGFWSALGLSQRGRIATVELPLNQRGHVGATPDAAALYALASELVRDVAAASEGGAEEVDKILEDEATETETMVKSFMEELARRHNESRSHHEHGTRPSFRASTESMMGAVNDAIEEAKETARHEVHRTAKMMEDTVREWAHNMKRTRSMNIWNAAHPVEDHTEESHEDRSRREVLDKMWPSWLPRTRLQQTSPSELAPVQESEEGLHDGARVIEEQNRTLGLGKNRDVSIQKNRFERSLSDAEADLTIAIEGAADHVQKRIKEVVDALAAQHQVNVLPTVRLDALSRENYKPRDREIDATLTGQDALYITIADTLHNVYLGVSSDASDLKNYIHEESERLDEMVNQLAEDLAQGSNLALHSESIELQAHMDEMVARINALAQDTKKSMNSAMLKCGRELMHMFKWVAEDIHA